MRPLHVCSLIAALALPGPVIALSEHQPQDNTPTEQARSPEILAPLFRKPLEKLRDRYLEDQRRNTVWAVMSACLDSFSVCATNWNWWYRVNYVDFDAVCLTIGPIQHSQERLMRDGDRPAGRGPALPYQGPGLEVLKRLQTASYPFPVYSGSDCPVTDERIVEWHNPTASRVYQFVHATVVPLGPDTVKATVSSSAQHGEAYIFKQQDQDRGWVQELENSWGRVCSLGMWQFKIAVR